MWVKIWLKDCDIISRYLGRDSSKRRQHSWKGRQRAQIRQGQPVSGVSAGRMVGKLVFQYGLRRDNSTDTSVKNQRLGRASCHVVEAKTRVEMCSSCLELTLPSERRSGAN